MNQLLKTASSKFYGATAGAAIGGLANAGRLAYQDRNKQNKRSLRDAAIKGALGGMVLGAGAGHLHDKHLDAVKKSYYSGFGEGQEHNQQLANRDIQHMEDKLNSWKKRSLETQQVQDSVIKKMKNLADDAYNKGYKKGISEK